MTDFAPQTTNQLPGDINKYNDKILFRGKTSYTNYTVTTSGSYSYATIVVDITQFVTTNSMPSVTAHLQSLGGKLGTSIIFTPLPYTIFASSTPTVQSAGWFTIEKDDTYSPARINLRFTLASLGSVLNDIYYQLHSTEPGATTLSGAWGQ